MQDQTIQRQVGCCKEEPIRTGRGTHVTGLPFSYRQVRHYDLKEVGRGRKGQINKINTKQNGKIHQRKDNSSNKKKARRLDPCCCG